MKISIDQLPIKLKQNLAPLYLIAGEELLLVQEAEDAICAAAKKAGFNERIRLTVDAEFDWSLFQQAAQNGSLFSDKQCLSLNLTGGKLTEAGKKIFMAFLQHAHSDKLLVIRMGKLDASLQKAAWYKMAEKMGIVIPVWPIAPAQLPNWIQKRLQTIGFTVDPEGLELLAARTQGNLLATAQEIEKLNLLYGKGHLSIKEIEEASSPSARFNVFHLIDAVLQENATKVIQIVNALKEEAVEPVLLIWALRREMHQWMQWLKAMQGGQSLSQILAGNFIMEKRRHLVERLLKRTSLENIYTHLQHIANIDRIIKGGMMGNIWDELRTLSLALTGVSIAIPYHFFTTRA